jgi:hypothetical protein
MEGGIAVVYATGGNVALDRFIALVGAEPLP